MWEQGDKDVIEVVLVGVDVVVEEMVYYYCIYLCLLEICGCVVSMDKVIGKLMFWGMFQVLYVIWIVVVLIFGFVEYNICVISFDIGGGFGNKVGVYFGYVCLVVVLIVIGKLVKWVEDWMENLMIMVFVCDYWMYGKIVVMKEGKIIGLWCYIIVDYGGFDVCVDLIKFFVGFMNICMGFYDILIVYLVVDGVYINKVLGGVVYCCLFCVIEVVYFIECMIEIFVIKLDMDVVELCKINFICVDQFLYQLVFGWEYDSGDYYIVWDKVLVVVDYDGLCKEQVEWVEVFKCGEICKLFGIGLMYFIEIVGVGLVKNCDIFGFGMFDSCEICIYLIGLVIVCLGMISQGQGYVMIFVQIIVLEIGLFVDDIMFEEGDIDIVFYGLGIYGLWLIFVVGVVMVMVVCKICVKVQMIVVYLFEVYDDDVEWDIDWFVVKGVLEWFKMMKEIVFVVYN